jgi:lipopolysaccharide/colanic/teichoic acid biosynthesis glycosyltransferase
MATERRVRSRLSATDTFFKRSFDFLCSLVGLLLFGWLIILAWLLASIETKSNGFFIQKRVGRYGKLFHVIKIRTMYKSNETGATVTVSGDQRVSHTGKIFRKTKIDELPQLLNVLIGQMSFVGPRPDVPGFADKLEGRDRDILSIRPGITGPASIKYRNEELLLAGHKDPEQYNRNVIFPDKVRINLAYIDNYSLWKDIYYIWKTFVH